MCVCIVFENFPPKFCYEIFINNFLSYQRSSADRSHMITTIQQNYYAIKYVSYASTLRHIAKRFVRKDMFDDSLFNCMISCRSYVPYSLLLSHLPAADYCSRRYGGRNTLKWRIFSTRKSTCASSAYPLFCVFKHWNYLCGIIVC